MRIVGRMEKLGDKMLFLGRVIERTARGYAVEANLKYRRDCCAWSGRLETSADSEREEDATDRVTGRAGDREASCVQNSREKAVVHVPRADITYRVKETARKIMCFTESDEMNVKRIARYLKGVPICEVLDSDQQIPSVRERVHRQRLDRTTPKRARALAVESHSGEARLCLLGQEHNSQ